MFRRLYFLEKHKTLRWWLTERVCDSEFQHVLRALWQAIPSPPFWSHLSCCSDQPFHLKLTTYPIPCTHKVLLMNQKRSQGMSNLAILIWRPSSHASLPQPAPQKPLTENSAAVVGRATMPLQQSGTTNSCKISYLSSCKCGKEKSFCIGFENACGQTKQNVLHLSYSIYYITYKFWTQ